MGCAGWAFGAGFCSAWAFGFLGRCGDRTGVVRRWRGRRPFAWFAGEEAWVGVYLAPLVKQNTTVVEMYLWTQPKHSEFTDTVFV